MMTGFKRRFEPFVRDGSKEHTLRDIRKGTRQIVQGDRLDCYGDVRQKAMHLIGRWMCIRVQVARFYWRVEPDELRIFARQIEHLRMSIDGVELTADEADAFAWRDGFRFLGVPHFEATHADNCYSSKTEGCFAKMMAYWIEEKFKFPFSKQLLHWKFRDRLPDALPKKKRVPKKRARRAR